MRNIARICSLAFFVFLTITSTTLLFTQQTPRCVALMTEVRGDVFVQPAQQRELKKALWGTQLYHGDVIKTSGSGQATLLFSNNNLIEVGPGSTLTISERPATLAKKSRTLSGLHSENLVDLSGLTLRTTSAGEIVALAGLRSVTVPKSVEPTSPRNSRVRSVAPTFSWQSGSGVRKYRVRVFDNKGLLWARETERTMLEYPSDEKPLRAGETYFWKVEGLGLVESSSSESFGFSVLSSDELAELESQERAVTEAFRDELTGTTCNFLLGTLYQKYGVLHEAITKFEAVAQNHADAPKAHEVLGKLYNDLGFKDKAISALQKALDLSQQK
ncbi:MAG: tetratricopeptide repeat protein [Ignavibacteria bacterium]|nr:tetratricopeptide repeat protein [Ignavibacteria bacterium]